MSISIDSPGAGKKSVDVEINLVPFIDMMSCLVAFLLVTAVWTNMAQIHIKPKGLGTSSTLSLPPAQNLSLLVATNAVWIGATSGERRQIKKAGDGYDWQGVAAVLADFKQGAFVDRDDIEIAGEDGTQYQAIIAAMDLAVTAGFTDVGYVDPASLSAKLEQ
jgi:biopolymer transport protein TolR